jgi:cytochrome c-type biogenesis protein CcmH/NrfF
VPISPAKFIYMKPQGTATTEVAINSTLTEDVYAIMNSVNPETKLGTFRVIVRPFVAWIWLGGMLMMLGTSVSMSPSVREVLGEVQSRARFPAAMGATATAVVLGVLVAVIALTLLAPALAHAQNDGSSSLHAGSVTMRNPEERQLFSRLLCECGDCQRLPLSSCVCSWAEHMRTRIRDEIAQGKSATQIQEEYRKDFGPQAIAIPSDKGLDRALWAVPVGVIVVMAGFVFRWGTRWKRKSAAAEAARPPAPAATAATQSSDASYDAALESELARLEERG